MIILRQWSFGFHGNSSLYVFLWVVKGKLWGNKSYSRLFMQIESGRQCLQSLKARDWRKNMNYEPYLLGVLTSTTFLHSVETCVKVCSNTFRSLFIPLSVRLVNSYCCLSPLTTICVWCFNKVSTVIIVFSEMQNDRQIIYQWGKAASVSLCVCYMHPKSL